MSPSQPDSHPTSSSVIVATYNQPRELDLALAALARQTKPPGEVLVADDGSGETTRDVAADWNERSPFSVLHVRQADRGYRKARIVNEAVRRSSGRHLIFLDGDSFPHRAWVEDHLASADGRSVLCGRRVKLGPRISPEVTRQQIEAGAFDSAFRAPLLRSRLRGDTKRLGLGVRLPRGIARALHPRPRKLMGVNFSLPREAFVAVNGYDQAWQVYGHEDRELELRLQRSGFPQKAVLNRAVVFHLHHDEREKTEETRRLIQEAEASDRTRCEMGLDQPELFDAAT